MMKTTDRNKQETKPKPAPSRQEVAPALAPDWIEQARPFADMPAHATSQSLRHQQIEHLQRRHGNGYVQRMLGQTAVHPVSGQLIQANGGGESTTASASATAAVAAAIGVAAGAGVATLLSGAGITAAAGAAVTGLAAPLLKSGAHWKGIADARGWGNSTSLDDLEDPFKTNTTNFVNALRVAGATVTIDSTRRSKVRAWLMHHAWRVANGNTPPADDPYSTGIIWDHDTRQKTIQAAKEMVSRQGFNIAFAPALTSLHIRGKAIDMTIENMPDDWTFTHGGNSVTVHLGSPHTGQNHRLHQAADRYFHVKKLVKDPPHWSINGS